MFPALVLELKVNLFSLTLCVLLPGGETVSQHSTIKEKQQEDGTSQTTEGDGSGPHKNWASPERAARGHRISPEDSV